MDTEECEHWLREYTIDLNNVLAERQARMIQPKLHRSYSDLAMINQQMDANFNQEDIILTRITDLVNYVEHFHITTRQITLKSLLCLYIGKIYTLFYGFIYSIKSNIVV